MATRPLVSIAALAWSYGVVSLLLHTPAFQPSTRAPASSVADTSIHVLEEQVYAVAIDELLTTFHTGLANVIERTEVIGAGDLSHAPRQQPPDNSFVQAASDYLGRNQAPGHVEVTTIPSFHSLRPVAAVDQRVGSPSVPLVALSRVGFNAAGDRAVLYIAFTCGGLCGEGDILWLRHTPDDGWRVIRRDNLWVS